MPRLKLLLATGLAIVLILAGCQRPAQRNITIARTYREHIARGEYDRARALLAPGARRWFGGREESAQPLDPRPGTGPWAAWDRHFRSSSEPIEWIEEPGAATVIVRETNDYYQLLERGEQTNALTYHIDDAGRITGLMIHSRGERPMGRTDEFLAWARVHAPDEINQLMPGGEIDPRGDHPQRFRALLQRWRAETAP